MEFKTFDAGDQIDNLGINIKTDLKLSRIKMIFPSRIHITPIDCNRFAFGEPGGGGIGFAVDLQNQLDIEVNHKIDKINSNSNRYTLIISHYNKIIKTIFNTEITFKFNLKLSDLVIQHFGLGSSTSVGCATIFGLNKLFGNPLTIDEIRRLVAYNFVEEYNGKLTKGLETGVGTSVILRGGISVVANDLIEIFNKPIPANKALLLIDPKTTRPNIDHPESMDMLERTFFLDLSYKYTKSYNILMDIIPALYFDDFIKFGKYVWDIQFSGTHLSIIQSYEDFGKKIYTILGVLKSVGMDVCGLSSVGPAIFSIYDIDKKDAIYNALQKEIGNEIKLYDAAFNNKGILITESLKI